MQTVSVRLMLICCSVSAVAGPTEGSANPTPCRAGRPLLISGVRFSAGLPVRVVRNPLTMDHLATPLQRTALQQDRAARWLELLRYREAQLLRDHIDEGDEPSAVGALLPTACRCWPSVFLIQHIR